MIRSGRFLSGIAALFLAAPLQALDPPAAVGAEIGHTVVLSFSPAALDSHVGKGAGLACLPNGKLRLRDFAPSPLLARDMLAETLGKAEAEGRAASRLSVTLQGLEGKLCARDYGVFGRGDRQSLSGVVTFNFAWTRGEGAVRQAAVRVEARRHGGETPGDLFGRALDELARRIRETG